MASGIFIHLPEEILIRIILELPLSGLPSVFLLNRQFYQFFKMDIIWENFYENYFPNIYPIARLNQQANQKNDADKKSSNIQPSLNWAQRFNNQWMESKTKGLKKMQKAVLQREEIISNLLEKFMRMTK